MSIPARLYVAEFGPQPSATSSAHSVLLVHGGASSHRMYIDVVPILTARGYKLIIPDLPGHGRSARTVQPFSFSSATSLLKQIIQAEKHSNTPKTLTLVGISLGGQVVLQLLSECADLVDNAIVSGVSIHPPDEQASWEMPYLPTEDERWMQILQEDIEAMGMENAKTVQNCSFDYTFDVAASTEGRLPPTLVLVGENDITMAKRDSEELVRILKKGNERSRKVVLDGAWHNHSIDVPGRFADVIDNWAKQGISM
jgi:pimeloyl-ACP methyl ester carboxylesterase